MRTPRSLSLLILLVAAAALGAASNVVDVSGDDLTFNGQPFKVIGLRCSNALMTEADTQELIAQLDDFKAYGVNTVSVFVMGSRFGDVKGYRPDASLDPTYADRLDRIVAAADQQQMVVLVGCLYWSTSRAKEDLGAWGQAEAELAVANTVRYLDARGHRNVLIDPDNEGMAHRGEGWDIGGMIAAAKATGTAIPIGYNDHDTPPANADLLMHFSPRDGVRPWIESEGSAGGIPNPPGGGYWGTYSKQTHQDDASHYNYSRIGRYTAEMKQAQIDAAISHIDRRSGYVMASTWLQCADDAGVGGPFMTPGGGSDIADVNAAIDELHPDAGVRWWLEAMRSRYGAWNPGTSTAPTVTAVYLIDAATDARIGPLVDGAVVDVAEVGEQLALEVVGEDLGSVVFSLDDGAATQTENNPPYAFPGDSGGDFQAWNLGLGNHRVTITPFSADGGGGIAGTSVSLGFELVDQPVATGPGLSAVYLIDATTDTRIQQLGEFTTIDLAVVGDRLSFEAVVNDATGSVVLSWDDGARIQIESHPPYSFTGDASGDFHPFTPAVGSHVLQVTPYAADGGAGSAGPGASFALTVLDGATAGVAINFQPANAPIPGGHLVDSGVAFAARGNGWSYGWDQANDQTRDRNVVGDQRYDTLNHLQKGGADRVWELELADGLYRVTLTSSDPAYDDQANHFLVEGVQVRDPDPLSDGFDQYAVDVEVRDGRLTIRPDVDAANAKLSVVVVDPVGSSTN